ncbi:MAG TPA: folate-binding protein [Bryocella sp.]|nr:folate-binding protein [Bryocella sp.]
MDQNLKAELDAILHGVAIASLDDRAFLRVTGSDATRWLNGMVTNSVQALGAGEGCYNFLLNAQGRILGDCTVYREPGEPATYLLETSASQVKAIQQHLDHFIIMDDVELTNGLQIIGHPAEGLTVVGASAPGLVHRLLSEINDADERKPLPVPHPATMTYADLPPQTHPIFHWIYQCGEGLVIVLAPHASSIPRYELWFQDRNHLNQFREGAKSANAIASSPETLEALRLLDGRPLYGRDITEKYLPQETNQPQALHFNKGCYLGQEIVERIRSRGQVHRLLTPLTLRGELPTDFPAPIEADGKPAGEITSAGLVPLREGDQILALGYVRREALDTHATLTYSGGTAVPRSAAQVQAVAGASK